MARGWIKLHRSIQDNELWLSEPFTKAQAWIDLLLLADSETNGKYKRGSVYRGKYWLANRWGWSRDKVCRFIDYLEREGMVTQKRTQGGTHNGTVITIVKYGFFQDSQSQHKAQYKAQNKAPIRNKEEEKHEAVVLPTATDLIYGGYK